QIGQFLCELTKGVDLKSAGSNLGGALRCGFSCQSFSQSASDGTVTSACLAYARCTALELCPNACCANRSGSCIPRQPGLRSAVLPRGTGTDPSETPDELRRACHSGLNGERSGYGEPMR